MDFGTELFKPGQLIDGHQVAGTPSLEHPSQWTTFCRSKNRKLRSPSKDIISLNLTISVTESRLFTPTEI